MGINDHISIHEFFLDGGIATFCATYEPDSPSNSGPIGEPISRFPIQEIVTTEKDWLTKYIAFSSNKKYMRWEIIYKLHNRAYKLCVFKVSGALGLMEAVL